MSGDLVSLRTLAYVVAGILFVLSLRGLSTQETARRGNILGTVGMLIAVLVTGAAVLWPATFTPPLGPGEEARLITGIAPETLGLLGGAIGVGCVIGYVLAARVAMTSMPELVAILHSFVGAAAVLVGIATYMQGGGHNLAHAMEVYIGVFIGAITF